MFEWLGDILAGMGEALGSAFGNIGEDIVNSVWNALVQWLYEAFYTAIGDLFADINNLGVEIFDLSWVQAVVNLFTMLGWSLFVVGVVVAVFILRAGWEAARDTLNPLLGTAPEPELVQAIQQLVLSHEEVVGMHDLVIHDYGPGRRMCSFHVEVPEGADIMAAHDAIDHIEREIQETFGIETTIHMDPIATGDSEVARLRDQVRELVRNIDPDMSIHDLRVTRGPLHSNLIFDVVVPHRCKLSDGEIKTRITDAVLQVVPGCYVVLQLDRSYVGMN